MDEIKNKTNLKINLTKIKIKRMKVKPKINTN
jgi:hypothetical protein